MIRIKQAVSADNDTPHRLSRNPPVGGGQLTADH
jgi:hypothetical protein